MTRARVAAVLWCVAALVYLGAEALAASQMPGYRYSVDFISDLGRPTFSPMAAWMNGAFMLQGVLFATAAILAAPMLRTRSRPRLFSSLAVAYGIGSVMVGLFHSGEGADNTAHIAGAVAAIVGGNLALIAVLLIDRGGFAVLSASLGVAGLVSAGLLLVHGATDHLVPFGGGFWERGGVYSVLLWQVLAAVFLLRNRARLVHARLLG